jgi:hypothetical protein
MADPEDELVDLLGDKPHGVVEISEQVSNENSPDRAKVHLVTDERSRFAGWSQAGITT